MRPNFHFSKFSIIRQSVNILFKPIIQNTSSNFGHSSKCHADMLLSHHSTCRQEPHLLASDLVKFDYGDIEAKVIARQRDSHSLEKNHRCNLLLTVRSRESEKGMRWLGKTQNYIGFLF